MMGIPSGVSPWTITSNFINRDPSGTFPHVVNIANAISQSFFVIFEDRQNVIHGSSGEPQRFLTIPQEPQNVFE